MLWAADAGDEEIALASYGQRGTDLLIETPTMKLVGIDHFLSALRAKGYRITLAHPERSVDFQRDDAPLRKLVAHGILLEVNAESVLGSDSDGRTHRFARHLMTEGLAHVLASDGHRGAAWRPVTKLADALDAALELVGSERADWMTTVAPAAIVDGSELPSAPPVIQQPKPRRLFGRRGR